jgi:hypothetical protein
MKLTICVLFVVSESGNVKGSRVCFSLLSHNKIFILLKLVILIKCNDKTLLDVRNAIQLEHHII